MQKYLLAPFDKSDLHNKIFNGPYGILRDLFRDIGIALQTYDQEKIADADKILFFNHHPSILKECENGLIDKNKLVLFLFEPEVVFPSQYKKFIWSSYGTIFTCRDDILGKEKTFHKFRYPQGGKFLSSLPSFANRKYVTLINSNWYSYLPNEVYSFRRKAIRYFENHSDGFDLFGHGWNNNSILSPKYIFNALKYSRLGQYAKDVYEGLHHYRSYRGSVSDKYQTLACYRFAICFENETNTKGYITEKIFDCFFSGTIPIYLGAQNISEYIPKKCYIDMTQFTNFADLDCMLKQMPEETFASYQRAGQDFIRSDSFAEWRPENIFQKIVKILK
ncbi:hypothetical protein EPN15_00970 [Patescibacteria group bacterium]|nr:MAG: hypothetical protein EPN15_00970 [Patescibacteria group bacterium]